MIEQATPQPGRERSRLWRCAYELAFALNFSFLARVVSDGTTGILSRFDFVSEEAIAWHINTYLHRVPDSRVGGIWGFIIPSIIQGIIVFVALEAASAYAPIRRLLNCVAGPISTIALPVVWLLIRAPINSASPGLPNPPHSWLWAEVIAALLYAICYLWLKALRSGWLAATPLVLHFALWSWLFWGGLYFWRDPFGCIFPLLGFLSVLLWGRQVSRSPEPRPA